MCIRDRIHAINYERRAAEGDNYVFETLSSKPADVDSKRKLLNYLKLTTKSDVFVKSIIKELGNKILTELIPSELVSLKAMVVRLSDIQ